MPYILKASCHAEYCIILILVINLDRVFPFYLIRDIANMLRSKILHPTILSYREVMKKIS